MQVLLISAAVAAVLGFGLGYRVADGACASRELAVANAYLSHAQSAADAARRDIEAESARRTEQAVQDARRAAASRDTRVKGQRHETVNRRVGCDWSPDRIRLLTAAVTTANGADAADTGERVPDQLPAATGAAADRR